MMRNGPSEKDETPIAQNKPETKRLDPVPKPPPDGKGQQPLTPVNPQPNPVTPPPKLAEIAKSHLRYRSIPTATARSKMSRAS